MLTESRRKPQPEDADDRRRRDQEIALDDALANTFPASDPISAEQPAPPDIRRRDLE
jgi:hypothetical protein